MLSRLLYRIFLIFIKYPKVVKGIFIFAIVGITVSIITSKLYQNFGDTDQQRGAIAMYNADDYPDFEGNENKESEPASKLKLLGDEYYSTPEYLGDQGWDPDDSLWYYNTTQGSALLPYDFFLELEKAGSQELVRSNQNMDNHRYLPQKPTNFNPDGLAVGFTKDTYGGRQEWYSIFRKTKSYVGYTCAACHTGQVNYQQDPSKPAMAIRIDGGPAMADMVGFLKDLEAGLKETRLNPEKRNRFVKAVLDRKGDYRKEKDVIADLEKWYWTTTLYNYINASSTAYGHARLDAFGRIYNRVLQYVLNTDQAKQTLALATKSEVYKNASEEEKEAIYQQINDDSTQQSAEISELNDRILTTRQIETLFADVNGEVILTDAEFAKVIQGIIALGLDEEDQLALRNAIFNEANAPVSYPFLWDIAQSDYVQWNGLANNSSVGPLGRNAGEVVGVFGILDWEHREYKFWKEPFSWFWEKLSNFASGQTTKSKHVTFDSSIDISNLRRLERKLQSLQSPQWPENIFGKIDKAKKDEGQKLYNNYCLSCHEVIDRADPDRLLVAKMLKLDKAGTDPVAAENGVNYKGLSGNFKDIYQTRTGVGSVVIEQEAPVLQMLTAGVSGVIATPDPDDYVIERTVKRIYNLVASLWENKIKASVKSGNYNPDTTSKPFDSLLAYKARSLNGIWATAPYLHNGSVPTLYDLLLPCEERPASFYVGSRNFDPEKVGFESDNPVFSKFDTTEPGNNNCGHEYAAGRTAQLDGETVLPALTPSERLAIIEYLKSL